MNDHKKEIPVKSILIVSNSEYEYNMNFEIDRVLCELSIYYMEKKISVVIEGDHVSLVSQRGGITSVHTYPYVGHIDEGEDGQEYYQFVGSEMVPNDELLICAIVRDNDED